MTLQQLLYVVALDNHRHFVKAAESCFVAQPTLTLQVKKLEEEVGMIIFDRSSQPLKPTPMGEKFILKAREIIRGMESLKEMVNEEREQLEGTYVLGIIPTLAPYLLPRFLKNFCNDHPKVKFEIKEMQSIQIIQALKANQLHIGIMATPVDDSAIREIPLFYEPFLVYASEGHPLLKKKEITPADIVEHGLWLLNEGHCFRNQVLNICNKTNTIPAHPGVSFESGSIETIKNMVQSDMGYSLVPELSVTMKSEKDLVRRFQEPELTREISMVVHNSFTKEVLLDHLRQTIIENVPSSFKTNNRFVRIKWR